MAVVNQYKFVGIDNDTTGNALNLLAQVYQRLMRL